MCSRGVVELEKSVSGGGLRGKGKLSNSLHHAMMACQRPSLWQRKQRLVPMFES